MVKLSRIAPELPASDLHASLNYYAQKLGFKVAMQMPDRSYAIVERDDIAIHLFEDYSKNDSPVSIHVFVEDIENLHDELMQRGAHISQKITRQPWGNRDFRVLDESRNILKFTEPLS